MQSCLKTNAHWIAQPLTPDTKKTRDEYREEQKSIRQGNTAFNDMIRRYSHALVNHIPAPHVAGLDE